MTSPSICCSQSTPRTALQFESLNDQVPGNQPIRRQHVMWNHVHSVVFACFFSHRKALFRFNDTPWIFFKHPVLSIIRFSCQLIFNKLLYTESVERKPLPALTKLWHGLHVCPSRKWRRWYEEGKREKKGWGMNRLQIKIMVLKFCSSCYLRLLATPDKTLEHLCKSCDNRKPCLVL